MGGLSINGHCESRKSVFNVLIHLELLHSHPGNHFPIQTRFRLNKHVAVLICNDFCQVQKTEITTN